MFLFWRGEWTWLLLDDDDDDLPMYIAKGPSSKPLVAHPDSDVEVVSPPGRGSKRRVAESMENSLEDVRRKRGERSELGDPSLPPTSTSAVGKKAVLKGSRGGPPGKRDVPEDKPTREPRRTTSAPISSMSFQPVDG